MLPGVYWIALATGIAIMLAACPILFRRGHPGLGGCLVLGLAFQVLLSIPAGIWQAATGWGYLTIPVRHQVMIPFLGWPFNAAGLSVRAFAIGLGSHWLSDPALYFSTMIMQVLAVAAFFAWRCSHRRSVRDPVLIVLGGLFLANSLLGAGWEWLPPG